MVYQVIYPPGFTPRPPRGALLVGREALLGGPTGRPYEADGRQFIAVPAALPGVFRSLTAQLTPDIYQPEGGNALYVFALPE